MQVTVAFSALVLACIGAGNVLLANVHSRRYEYGVLRSVGAGRSMLLRLICAEALLLGVSASITGTILGMHLARVAQVHCQDLLGLRVSVSLPVDVAALGWIILIGLTFLAALPGALLVVKPAPSRLLAAGRGG